MNSEVRWRAQSSKVHATVSVKLPCAADKVSRIAQQSTASRYGGMAKHATTSHCVDWQARHATVGQPKLQCVGRAKAVNYLVSEALVSISQQTVSSEVQQAQSSQLSMGAQDGKKLYFWLGWVLRHRGGKKATRKKKRGPGVRCEKFLSRCIRCSARLQSVTSIIQLPLYSSHMSVPPASASATANDLTGRPCPACLPASQLSSQRATNHTLSSFPYPSATSAHQPPSCMAAGRKGLDAGATAPIRRLLQVPARQQRRRRPPGRDGMITLCKARRKLAAQQHDHLAQHGLQAQQRGASGSVRHSHISTATEVVEGARRHRPRDAHSTSLMKSTPNHLCPQHKKQGMYNDQP